MSTSRFPSRTPSHATPHATRAEPHAEPITAGQSLTHTLTHPHAPSPHGLGGPYKTPNREPVTESKDQMSEKNPSTGPSSERRGETYRRYYSHIEEALASGERVDHPGGPVCWDPATSCERLCWLCPHHPEGDWRPTRNCTVCRHPFTAQAPAQTMHPDCEAAA